MATYSVDSTKQALRATGVVEPVTKWVEDPTTGKRRQSDVQDCDDNGTPLWGIEVTYVAVAFGRMATTVGKVTVPSATEPVVAAFDVVPFEGLSVNVSVNRTSGALREYWNADGIAQIRKAAA